MMRSVRFGSVVAMLMVVAGYHAGMSQGKIVLVGGGSEDFGSWSDAPYKWAVDQSTNKKVAVISYADETEWIPDYFLSLGAARADNIRISSRSLADQMYDSLMKYDVFFFKGGDQYNYYRFFKDTQVTEAIHDKFQQGGVMAGTSAGMAILSGVIFTAEESSVYPDEALSDFKSASITLANDFTSLLPGFIVDSHFTERGRIGRLLAFIANWNFQHDEWLTGIGVDDRTALCIDESNKALVFGTGSVSFFRTDEMTSFQDEKPVADSVGVIQLLHGHSIQLPDLTILHGPQQFIQPLPQRNTGTYAVLLSGSESIASNVAFLDAFIQHGHADDSIVVVTAPAKGTSFISRLEDNDARFTVVETNATNNNEDQRELRDAIRRSKKVLFVDNDDNTLFTFLEGGKTGALIRTHIRRNNILTGFVGEDSRYAGKVFVTNHLSNAYNAYYGDLNYKRGLDLLRSSVVMSNTYDASTTDFYENTTAAVSYAMVRDSLRYGIYLNRSSYVRFDQDGLSNFFEGRGQHSTILLINNDSKTALASQAVNAAGDVRNYAGYSNIRLALLNGSGRVEAGSTVPSIDPPYQWESIVLSSEEMVHTPALYPNPTTGLLYYNGGNIVSGAIEVLDICGKYVLKTNEVRNQVLDLSDLPDGIYFVRFRNLSGFRTQKVILAHDSR